MNVRQPYVCLTCNREMVLRRSIPNHKDQSDISIWGCLHCSERQETSLAVLRDAPLTPTEQAASSGNKATCD